MSNVDVIKFYFFFGSIVGSQLKKHHDSNKWYWNHELENGDVPTSLITIRQGAIYQVGLLLIIFCGIVSLNAGMSAPIVK